MDHHGAIPHDGRVPPCPALIDVGIPRAQYQYMASWTEEDGWRGKLKPYGPLELLPSAQVLNYGQSIFEGMKVGAHCNICSAAAPDNINKPKAEPVT